MGITEYFVERGFNRRRTWGGKLDSTLSSNSILETIEEDVNLPRPSVPSNFGVTNKETFKTPLEPFEWDLIREEDCKIVIDQDPSISNTEISSISPPPGVCETPRKILRERVNNYKSLFEMSMRENNELREFTTLEKQMFHENNEQLKDLKNLKKQIEELQAERDASSEIIEKLRISVTRIENEKRDIEVVAEVQKEKYENREKELLNIIKEIREELLMKDDQLKKFIANNSDMTEKYEEIKRLEMKIKDMSQQHTNYINEFEIIKSKLSEKDTQLKVELSQNLALENKLSEAQKHITDIKSLQFAIQFLADHEYCVLKKKEICELDLLLGESHHALNQLQLENYTLIDENNNFKSLNSENLRIISELKNENCNLQSELNTIEMNIKSIIKKNCNQLHYIEVEKLVDVNNLIKFTDTHFESLTNNILNLSNENLKIKEELAKTYEKITLIRTVVSENLDSFLKDISLFEIRSNNDCTDDFKEKNVLLLSFIETFDDLTIDNLVELFKIKFSKMESIQEEFNSYKAINNELETQNKNLKLINMDLNESLQKEMNVTNNKSTKLDIVSKNLEDTLCKLNEIQSNSDLVTKKLKNEVQELKIKLEDKLDIITAHEKCKNQLLIKCEDIKEIIQSNTKVNYESIDNPEIVNWLKNYLSSKSSKFESALYKIKEMQNSIQLLINKSDLNSLNIEGESNESLSKNCNILDESKSYLSRENSLNEGLDKNLNSSESVHNHSNIFVLTEFDDESNKFDNSLTRINESQSMIEEIIEDIYHQILQSSYIESENSVYKSKTKNPDVSSEKIEQPFKIIDTLKTELEAYMSYENNVKCELQSISLELEKAHSKLYDVKNLIDSLNNKCNSYVLNIEKLKSEFEIVKIELNEKNNLISTLESTNSNLLEKCNNLEQINQLTSIIDELKSDLEAKLIIESDLRNNLLHKSNELEDICSKYTEIQSTINEKEIASDYKIVIEQLNIELAEKSSLLADYDNLKSEIDKYIEQFNQLNNIITDLKVDIETEKSKNHSLQSQLQAKTIDLDEAFAKENEVQTLIESMENEIQANIISFEKLNQKLQSEILEKSNIVAELDDTKLKLQSKTNEVNRVNCEKLAFEVECKHLEQELINIKKIHCNCEHLQSKFIILTNQITDLQKELNHTNEKLFDMSKQYYFEKQHSDIKLQLQTANNQKLINDFIELSNNIELFLASKIDIESNLREEIVVKTGEIADLQKQLMESTLQLEYERLEEEYVSKSRDITETQSKLETFEALLLKKNENEQILQDKYQTKCKELNEYKKNLEFLCSRNDSFLNRVDDFEDNVLVALNDEMDSMKLELEKKQETEKLLIDEKTELRLNLNKVKEVLINTTDELNVAKEQIKILENKVEELLDSREKLLCKVSDSEKSLVKSKSTIENLNIELNCLNKELSIKCSEINDVRNELQTLMSNINEQKICNEADTRNQLIDPLVDYVHEIKLKLTELNSAMISGNKCEKQLRTKRMLLEDDISTLDDASWKLNCEIQPGTPVEEIDLEIETLRKVLEDKMNLVSSLQKTNIDLEKNMCDLQDKIEYINKTNKESDEKLSLLENNLKEKCCEVENLNVTLEQLKQQYAELENLNLTLKDQIHQNLDIDLELRNGKKNIVNEINLLEPGKITGILTHHNLTDLLDTFVSLIMTKEQQIVSDLISEHKKIKQQYEDEIKQLQEDIKKAKEWQEQVESDNEKLSLELEELKSQKHSYPSKETENKELKERAIKAETQSLNYFNELNELKAHINNTNKQNYQILSDEFEFFKLNTEKTMNDLEKKVEDLTSMYNESCSLYKDQKNYYTVLENKLKEAQLEAICLKSVLEQKENDIKTLVEDLQLKSKEYEALCEKNSIQREEILNMNSKNIDELQLELNDKTQKLYNTEKLLKEATKNYNQLLEENKLLSQKIQNLPINDNTINNKVAELEHDVHNLKTENKIKEITELELKTKLDKTVDQCSLLAKEIETYTIKISLLENQLENCHQTIKFKEDQIENYQMKSKIKDSDLIELNEITNKLRKILKSSADLSVLVEDIQSQITKCECLEEELEELKRQNNNLDSECESMLIELKSKDDKLLEFLNQEDELRKANEVLIQEIDFLRTKCDQFKNINDDVKKLNEEICSYQQSIYQLRKEKGQVILQHDKEIKQLKAELGNVHNKNLELLNEHKKITETSRNVEKSLKEDIQQLNRCIVDKNAKISTLELLSKTNTDELKNRNQELEHVYKRVREENHMMRKELRRLKEITSVRKSEQSTQTIEEQSVVSSAMAASSKSMIEKIAKLENDNHVMKKMLHHRKTKIEELQKQIEERAF
ncbi:putative leucine-rich repeat-containing protein DDB_G0290503 isoform X2 [Daktulosphaira vitifoliae]|uniref:putative leucine-rich repeat-containing protein DDB_G0290503 isoform X2 n=1 Tax=Daktulosphaira vitifoliae TaxID=58002 RepID=UPI0021A9DCBF|nr:putative leucine-rich repeat-containing protein DDB_G0290503 isoform X2 [Daktulosphaira vitifoliae]